MFSYFLCLVIIVCMANIVEDALWGTEILLLSFKSCHTLLWKATKLLANHSSPAGWILSWLPMSLIFAVRCESSDILFLPCLSAFISTNNFLKCLFLFCLGPGFCSWSLKEGPRHTGRLRVPWEGSLESRSPAEYFQCDSRHATRSDFFRVSRSGGLEPGNTLRHKLLGGLAAPVAPEMAADAWSASRIVRHQ